MASFRYKYGDRPLDGYTIQRGAGRGGFGEVYYALSDSGREVALKVVNDFEQIELRGVSQCMNLKSPHLVTIFDVRHNADGTPFIIMEYVSGPSLRQLLDEAPSGLGPQKAAFFLREIGKGLTFLHDCGIVHRDLKPGNIFYENGYAKIGDYGLSKAISATQNSGQTITVGTVHYMAPEVGLGRYDRGIDIYAMGAILHELLTGQTPFIGASPAEILMKHLSAQIDLTNIPEPFATVIRKAMAKDPKDRYQSVQEMVEAVFGAESVQESMSTFSPQSLSMVAQRAAQRVAVGAAAGGGGGPSSATPPPLPPRYRSPGNTVDEFGRRIDRVGQRIDAAADRFGSRMGELGSRLGERVGRLRQRVKTGKQHWRDRFPAAAGSEEFAADSLGRGDRKLLAVLTAILVAVATFFFCPPHQMGGEPLFVLGFVFVGVLWSAAGILIARYRVFPRVAAESLGVRRLAMGGMACAAMVVLAIPMSDVSSRMAQTWLSILVPLFLMNWAKTIELHRSRRIAFSHAVKAGVLGYVSTLIFGGSPELTMGMLAGISLTAQAMAPWLGQNQPETGKRRPAEPTPIMLLPLDAPLVAPPASPAGGSGKRPPLPPPLPVAWRFKRVPLPVRIVWMILGIAALSGALALGVMATDSHWRHDPAWPFGVTLLLTGIVFLKRSVQSTFLGIWSYLLRPLTQLICLMLVLLGAWMLGEGPHFGGDPAGAAFMIAFFTLIFLSVTFLHLVVGRPQTPAPTPLRAQPQPQPLPPPPMSLLSLGLVIVGSMILLKSLVIGFLWALDLPGLIASGALDPGLKHQIDQALGYDRWPRLARDILNIVTHAGMFLATVLLMISRRRRGVGYMLRAPLAAILFLAGLWGFADNAYHYRWAVLHGPTGAVSIAATVDAYLRHIEPSHAVAWAVIMMAGAAILLWPPAAARPVGLINAEAA